MTEVLLTPSAPQINPFCCEVKLKEKKFSFNLNVQDDFLEIKFSEMSPNNFIQKSYKEIYTYDSLQKVHKFFLQFENIKEIFSAIKNAVVAGSYKLEESGKKFFLIISCFGKEIKMIIPEKSKTDDDKIMSIANSLLELKNNFIKKLTELDKINQSFFKIKKRSKELIKENKELNENNEKINKENKELNEVIKNLKETRIENINDDIKILLENSLMTDEERSIFRKFKGKLTGDLLNENTIAFDNLCKAYLCNWLSDSGNNKKIKTVLLYKGSRDGDKAATFHEKCNNKGATLTLVKSTTNFHFGGFTTTSWQGKGNWRNSPGSFLFSLDKKLKYSAKINENHIYDNSSDGPSFGGGTDLRIYDECMSNEKSYSYRTTYNITDSFSGSKNFKVSEIEVYQVIFR